MTATAYFGMKALTMPIDLGGKLVSAPFIELSTRNNDVLIVHTNINHNKRRYNILQTKRILLLLASMFLFFLFPNAGSAAEIKQGYPAPDFKLNTLDGKIVQLSDYKGKKVILNFWASWCSPCKTEMPVMENFFQENKDKDIVLLSVNLTKEDQSKKAVKQFADRLHLTFPIPLDEKGEVSDLYQVMTIPTTYFIDAEGILQQKVIGPLNKDLITQLLKEM